MGEVASSDLVTFSHLALQGQQMGNKRGNRRNTKRKRMCFAFHDESCECVLRASPVFGDGLCIQLQRNVCCCVTHQLLRGLYT